MIALPLGFGVVVFVYLLIFLCFYLSFSFRSYLMIDRSAKSVKFLFVFFLLLRVFFSFDEESLLLAVIFSSINLFSFAYNCQRIVWSVWNASPFLLRESVVCRRFVDVVYEWLFVEWWVVFCVSPPLVLLCLELIIFVVIAVVVVAVVGFTENRIYGVNIWLLFSLPSIDIISVVW